MRTSSETKAESRHPPTPTPQQERGLHSAGQGRGVLVTILNILQVPQACFSSRWMASSHAYIPDRESTGPLWFLMR